MKTQINLVDGSDTCGFYPQSSGNITSQGQLDEHVPLQTGGVPLPRLFQEVLVPSTVFDPWIASLCALAILSPSGEGATVDLSEGAWMSDPDNHFL